MNQSGPLSNKIIEHDKKYNLRTREELKKTRTQLEILFVYCTVTLLLPIIIANIKKQKFFECARYPFQLSPKVRHIRTHPPSRQSLIKCRSPRKYVHSSTNGHQAHHASHPKRRTFPSFYYIQIWLTHIRNAVIYVQPTKHPKNIAADKTI